MEYHVPSVGLAARVLKLLSRHKYRRCSLTDIADKLQVNKTTCLRVLKTLEREDFVKYNPETRKYSLGPYLIPLGNRAAELNDAVARAIAEMRLVSAATGLTTVLADRLQDDRLIYIASAEPPDEQVRIAVSVGQQLPLTGGAFGKCFLAYDSEDEWQRFATAGLTAYTPHTIVDPSQFHQSLTQVRAQGYAVSRAELMSGITAVAAPIFAQDGQVELVMACLCVTSERNKGQEERVIHELTSRTRKLSEWAGY